MDGIGSVLVCVLLLVVHGCCDGRVWVVCLVVCRYWDWCVCVLELRVCRRVLSCIGVVLVVCRCWYGAGRVWVLCWLRVGVGIGVGSVLALCWYCIGIGSGMGVGVVLVLVLYYVVLV